MKRAPVLVLGATGGVGQAVCRSLGSAGFEVIGSCRTATQARSLQKEGVCAQTVRLSLDRGSSIDAGFASLAERGLSSLAGIVNCAAITQPQPLELASLDAVRRTFEINLFGALHATQCALPMLRKANGRIVFVSSTSGFVGVPLLGAYSASKFALEALADVLRRELSAWDIGVSLVIPGGIRTPMIDAQLAEIDAELAKLKGPLATEYARQYRQHRRLIELAGSSAVTPERVAEDVRRALSEPSPKARYFCGAPSKAARAMSTLLPDGVLDELFDRLPGSKRSVSPP